MREYNLLHLVQSRGLHCPWFKGKTRLGSVECNLDTDTGTKRWLVRILILLDLTFGVPRGNQTFMAVPVEARSPSNGTQTKGVSEEGPRVTQMDGRLRRERLDKVRPG